MKKNKDSDLVRELIKSLLNRQGMNYSDLAKAMGVSLPTIKRWMTTDDFSLDRLSSIAAWFGYNLFEFMELTKDLGTEWIELTHEQESLLAKNPQLAYVNLLLVAGMDRAEVLRRVSISKPEFESYLSLLEQHGFLQRWPGDKLRILIRGPYKMTSQGPFERAYYKKFYSVLLKHFSGKARGFQYVPDADGFFFRPFEMYLSPEMAKELAGDLSRLIKQYRERSKLYHGNAKSKHLQPVVGVVALDQFDGWGEVLR